MRERELLHARFACLYGCNRLNGPVIPSDESILDRAETALDTLFPQSYREFMCLHGPVFTPTLWEAIAAKELTVDPVREFLTPEEIIRDNPLCWGGGMPRDHVGIASDFMGGLFGFAKIPRTTGRPDEFPIQLFDADYCTIVPIANSFDEWLSQFMRLVGILDK